jgi:preprotein translocase subunit SecE
MKKPDEVDKKKGRDKGLQASGVQTGAGNGRALQENRNRGGQVLAKKEGRKEEKGSILRYVGIAGQFLRESRTELKKVKWPTKKELLASTAAVIVLVLVVSLYLGIIDLGLVKIIQSIVG